MSTKNKRKRNARVHLDFCFHTINATNMNACVFAIPKNADKNACFSVTKEHKVLEAKSLSRVLYACVVMVCSFMR